MHKRRWTLLVVPHGSSSSRAIEISSAALKAAIVATTVFTVAAVAFAYITISRSVDLTRLAHLTEANRLLAKELATTRTRVDRLNDTLHAIDNRDREMRLVAGLEPLDPGVERAGIGGPVGAWPERDTLATDGPTGRAAINLHLDVNTLTRRADLLAGSFAEALDSLQAHTDRLRRLPSIMPTAGYLSSPFAASRIHPLLHYARPHEGIDIATPMGTPIVAPAGGVVIQVGTEPGYGKIVSINHGYGIETRYAHCSKILVHVGQRVKRGQEIALVGSTGISTGPHLHYEVLVNHKHVNPLKYVFPETIVD